MYKNDTKTKIRQYSLTVYSFGKLCCRFTWFTSRTGSRILIKWNWNLNTDFGILIFCVVLLFTAWSPRLRGISTRTSWMQELSEGEVKNGLIFKSNPNGKFIVFIISTALLVLLDRGTPVDRGTSFDQGTGVRRLEDAVPRSRDVS